MTALVHGALWYAGSGVVALAACRLISWLKQRREGRDTFMRDLLTAMEPPRPQWVKRLKTAGMWVMALLIWPFAVGIVVSDLAGWVRRSRIPERKVDPEDKFYAKGNLLQEVTIETAESRERYIDPLGLVPALPFGHLHDGWKRFLTRKPDGDARLWAFHRKTDDENWSFDRASGTARGYCWVVDGKVVAEIVVEN